MQLSLLLTFLLGLALATFTVADSSQADGSKRCRPTRVPKYAPVPESALGPVIDPAVGYAVEHLGGGAYVVTEGLYQAFFLVSDEGVILVDAPPSLNVLLNYAIGNITEAPVKKIVYSHFHADHIESAGLFEGEDVEFIAHEETSALLERLNRANVPKPQTTFSDVHTVIVGNQTLELSYKGENHVPGNIFIHAPKLKILMLVDIIIPRWAPVKELAVSSDVAGYIKAHDQVLEYDFDIFLGGHVQLFGTRQDVLNHKAYMEDLQKECTAVIKESSAPDSAVSLRVQAVAKANPRNVYASFDEYLDAASEACDARVTPKWTEVLAGADVFGFDNAIKMVNYLRTDIALMG